MPRTGLSPTELKQAAVAAALTRMRSVGFDKVRLSDVAKDVGVSHAALYTHFKDKSHLLDAVIEQWLSESDLESGKPLPENGDPEEAIIAWFSRLYQIKRRRALTDPEPFRALDMASASEKPFIAAHFDKQLDRVASLLRDGGPALAGVDPRHRARLLFTAASAFHHPSILVQNAEQDRDADLRDILALLLKGFQAERT